jgi:hypothetical protein
MKSITSLQEAAQAINELQNRLDTATSKNWDRRQTRIVNAHPSVDPYDYVVRKELDERLEVTTVKSGEVEYKATFGLNDASVGSDKTPHFHILKGGSLFEIRFNAKVAPTGCTFKMKVYVQLADGSPWVSILSPSTYLEIPVGNDWINYYTDFTGIDLLVDNTLMKIAVEVGDSKSVCREVEVVVRWR